MGRGRNERPPSLMGRGLDELFWVLEKVGTLTSAADRPPRQRIALGVSLAQRPSESRNLVTLKHQSGCVHVSRLPGLATLRSSVKYNPVQQVQLGQRHRPAECFFL
jgi:hypothetical protein